MTCAWMSGSVNSLNRPGDPSREDHCHGRGETRHGTECGASEGIGRYGRYRTTSHSIGRHRTVSDGTGRHRTASDERQERRKGGGCRDRQSVSREIGRPISLSRRGAGMPAAAREAVSAGRTPVHGRSAFCHAMLLP